MAYTFLKVSDGMAIGACLYDEEGAKIVPDIMAKAKTLGVEIVLPVDFVISSKFGEDGDIREATMEAGIPDGFVGLDCGPKSVERIAAAVAASKTILWNGPVGAFEMSRFEACTRFSAEEKVTHCSTGGGASLELLEGKALPAVAALDAGKAGSRRKILFGNWKCNPGSIKTA